jgi:hypothetical protein
MQLELTSGRPDGHTVSAHGHRVAASVRDRNVATADCFEADPDHK